MPELSVVIVSYNTRQLLQACLRSLQMAAHSDRLEVETIVVDNNSSDGSAELVASEFANVKLICNPTNAGFAAASNQGLRLAGGRYPLLLNPDTELRPGALRQLYTFARRAARFSAIGPSLIYADGSPQHSCFRFPGLNMLALDLFPLHHRLMNGRLNGRYQLDRRMPFNVDHPLGACMLLNPAALADVGLLDEGFFIYAEEVDWCWRAQKRNWQAYCVPAAQVLHHAGQSTRQFKASMFVELYRSRARLFSRHYHLGRRLMARLIVAAGMARLALRDAWLAGRGELDAAELAERRSAYAAILKLQARPWRR